MKLIIHGLEEVPGHHEPLSRKSTTFPAKPQGYDSILNNAEQRKAPKRARLAVAYRRLEGLERMPTPPAKDVERSSGRRPTDRAVVRSDMARHSWLDGYVRLRVMGALCGQS